MRHAVYLPPFAAFAEPERVVALAVTAEQAGWDGLFVWDHMCRSEPGWEAVADPWIVLAAVAQATERLRIGPMIVPLARRRPQKVARETVTLDRLSGGRLTVGVGLGVDSGGELARFAEVTDDRARGDVLDEALEVLRLLWGGGTVHHRGPHFSVDGVAFAPQAVQPLGIPLWGAARSTRAGRALRRAATLDGLFPVDVDLDQLGAMLDVVRRERGDLDGYDVAAVAAGAEPGAYEAVGVTWLLAGVNEGEPLEAAVDKVAAGPPA